VIIPEPAPRRPQRQPQRSRSSTPTTQPQRAPHLLRPVLCGAGIASWYGVPFHGRRAANGEVFDMNTLVRHNRTPVWSILRVTNLNNGRHIEVRVIDRGPHRDRVLDLARRLQLDWT